jgi:hypothetical protein
LLEPRDLPTGSPAWAAGAAPGGEPRVWEYDADGNQVASFLAYDASFTGGVRVAVTDLTGDGIMDVITAPGPGGGPHVRVFDGATGASVLDFFAYDESFLGGVWVAAGPVGGGAVGIATGADADGSPHVKVFAADGTELQSFFAFDETFAGGVRVALGQTEAGSDVYVANGPGMAPTVRAFSVDSGTQVFGQAAGDEAETGGVWVAAGDLLGDGRDEVLTAAGSGPGTEVREFDGANGLWAGDATVSGPAYGVGVLSWGGQPAVGVLGATTLAAYALGDFGAAATALGSVDATGWGGGVGASFGAAPAAGAPSSTVLFTHTDYWIPIGPLSDPDELGSVTVEVTDGGDTYPGRYHWKYTFASLHFNQSPPGYTYFTLALADLPDIADIATSTGWDHDGTLSWHYDLTSQGQDIEPGQPPVTFEFTTLPRLVVPIQGTTNDQLGMYGVGGTTFGPGDEKPRIEIDYPDLTVAKTLKVAKWQDAFALNPDGKSAYVKDPTAGTNLDFIDGDPDRFNVWVYDKTAWDNQTTHIQAKISTKNVAGFTEYDDNATAVDLVRYTGAARGPGWYWSDSQMLVSFQDPCSGCPNP